MEYQAIRNICQKYLDVSRMHTARYTFNKLAKQAEAILEERQGMLMHSSPVTTQIYKKQLERGTNDTDSYQCCRIVKLFVVIKPYSPRCSLGSRSGMIV